jgi:hypothetical protein
MKAIQVKVQIKVDVARCLMAIAILLTLLL